MGLRDSALETGSSRFKFILLVAAAVAALALALPGAASAAFTATSFSVTPSTTVKSANPSLVTAFSRGGNLLETARDVEVKYPAGLTLTLPPSAQRCSTTQFNGDSCPGSSRVGAVALDFKTSNGSSLVATVAGAPGNVYALADGSLGLVLRPSGYGKLFVKQTLTTASGSVTAKITGFPKKIALLGIIQLDLTVTSTTITYQAKANATSSGPVFVTNPSTCGTNTSNLKLTSYQNVVATRTSAFTTTGCGAPPVVAITAPAAAANVTSPFNVAYTVNGAASIPAGTTCTVQGNSSSSATTNSVTAPVGPLTITVSCTNANGTGTNTRNVTVGAAPVVAITSPANGTSGTSPVNVAYTVNGAPSIPAGTTCTVNGSASSSATTNSVSAPTGPLSITVACANAFGTGTAVVTFTIVPAPPNTTITKFASPSAAASAVGETVEFSGSGSAFECRLDSGAYVACVSPWSPPISGLSSPALHSYEVRAVNGGTPDATPEKGYIWIDSRSFAATSTAGASANSVTSVGDAYDAGRHPDVTASFNLEGAEDVQTVASMLPDGLMLNPNSIAVAQQCSVADANAGTCPASANVGTVAGTVVNPREGSVSVTGNLFLVDNSDASLPTDSAATLAYEISLPGGASSLGAVRSLGIVRIPFTETARNMQITASNIPASTVGGTESRSTARRFHVQSLSLTIKGDVGAPAKPFVTNPHYCGSDFTNGGWAHLSQHKFVTSVIGAAGSGVGNVLAAYATTDCATTAFAPTFDLTLDDNDAGHPTQVDVDLQLPPEAAATPNATIARSLLYLPPGVSPNFATLGSASQQCSAFKIRPGDLSSSGFQLFDKNYSLGSTPACPANSLVGTARITTPLFSTPVVADIYLISKSVIPRFGIWIDPSVAPTNPKGLTAGFLMKGDTVTYPADPTFTALALSLDSLPDLPISRLQLSLGDRPARALGQKIFVNATDDDPSCTPGATGFGQSSSAMSAILRLRPWAKVTSDAQMAAWSSDTLQNLTAADTELQDPVPLDGCGPAPEANPPAVDITAPADGATITTASVTLSYSASDESPYSCDKNSGISVPLALGSNTITVTCTDFHGNIGSDTVTVTRVTDTLAPTVDITSPTDGAVVTTDSVPLQYTVTDDYDSSPTCTRANNSTVTLADGLNTIVVSCTDDAGNTGSDSVQVTYNAPDTVAPNVNIVSPVDGSTATFSPISLVFSVSDDKDPTPTCDHASGDPINLNEGANVITVSCSDDAGNVGTDSVTVYYIPVAGPDPETLITTFAPPSAQTSSTVSVEFTGTNALGFECRVDTGAWSACSSPWTPSLSGLSSPAQHTYEVRGVAGSQIDASPAKGYIWIDNRAWGATAAVTALGNAVTPAANAYDAGRHPDVSATVSIQGYDDPQTAQVTFPDGMMGSLAAIPVAQRCTLSQANAGTCPASSRIGSASGTAVSPRDGTLTGTGDLYLVDSADAAIPSDAAAAVALEATPPAGSEDLGQIRGLGYLKVPFIHSGRNVQMVVNSIPNATQPGTGTESRTSARRFHALTLSATIDGDIGATSDPATSRPLVTNPHYCGSVFTNGGWGHLSGISTLQHQFVGSGTGYNGSTVNNVTAAYPTTNCANTAFAPTLTLVSSSDVPGDTIRLDADFQLPPEAANTPNATIGRAVAQLPPQVSPYFPSFGAASQQCSPVKLRPSNTTTAGFQYFDKNFTSGSTPACPAVAIVGTATITTPLVPDPIVGKIYFINKSPIPNIGIWVDPTIAPTNPKGVTVGLVGKTSTQQFLDDTSFTALTLSLDSIPDLPITRLQLAIGDNPGRGALGAKILVNATADDPSCLPNSADPRPAFDAITRMRPWTKITSDAQMGAWSGDTLLTDPLTATDTELRNSSLGLTGCT